MNLHSFSSDKKYLGNHEGSSQKSAQKEVTVTLEDHIGKKQ
jgi:hypothetical protein